MVPLQPKDETPFLLEAAARTAPALRRKRYYNREVAYFGSQSVRYQLQSKTSKREAVNEDESRRGQMRSIWYRSYLFARFVSHLSKLMTIVAIDTVSRTSGVSRWCPRRGSNALVRSKVSPNHLSSPLIP